MGLHNSSYCFVGDGCAQSSNLCLLIHVIIPSCYMKAACLIGGGDEKFMNRGGLLYLAKDDIGKWFLSKNMF